MIRKEFYNHIRLFANVEANITEVKIILDDSSPLPTLAPNKHM